MDIELRRRGHHHQAAWTRPMRRELYRRVQLASRSAALDVGCGDGLITEEMARVCRGMVIGVDADRKMIEMAQAARGKAAFLTARAEALPFSSWCFDLVSAHWLMMWVSDPRAVLQEFRRVLKPGGRVLLACEPDYGGRMVYPEEAELKQELLSALAAQGADPLIGRKLPGLLRGAGFAVQCGLYPGAWDSGMDQKMLQQEQEWLSDMLAAHVPAERLAAACTALTRAYRAGSLFMATAVAWAIGTAPR